MPRISFFFGITIAMFWDERGHQVAHFHAEYSGHLASIAVDGTLLGGTLPRRQLRLVREWAQLHRDELLADWERARGVWSLWSESHPSLNMVSMEGVPPLVHLTDVEVIGEYKLRITFEDGTVGDVSFDRRDWTGVFEPFRDPAVFAQVYVDKQFRSLAWPNGLDMAPEPLYQDALRNPVQQPAQTR